MKAIAAWLLCCTWHLALASAWREHPDWRGEFARRGVEGTALIYDERGDRYEVFDAPRARRAFLPASTFKICNAMVAIDTGAVRDEYDVVRWDGIERERAEWNRDQSLASAMRFSAVWFYQEMARRAGEQRMRDWLERAGYGNADIGGGIDRFWLGGDLRISAEQQIDFLRRLADGRLPFSARAQEIARRITIVNAAPGYIEHGKPGWGVHGGSKPERDIGWYVGWIERDGRRWFFAVNLDIARTADGEQRVALAHALLQRVGALPN